MRIRFAGIAFLLTIASVAHAADGPAAPTRAALEIESFELAGSRLGPARADRVFYATERVVVRLKVRGFGAPASDPGGFALGIGLAVRKAGAEGKVPRVGSERGPNAFGASSAPVTLSFPIGGAVTSGEQELVVAVEDEPSGRRVERRERFEVRAPDRLVILGTYFAADGAGEIERPPVFTVGEDVLLRFAAAGFAPRNGKVRGRTDLRVRDASGALVSERRGLMTLETEVKPGVAAIDGSTSLTATRAGIFRLEIEQHDLNALTTATVERTIEVRPTPER